MPRIENSLGKLRQQRRLSAIELAAIVGVKRQTIYAMEAGSYVPNTTVALKLARALDATVEELFALPGDGAPVELRSAHATLLPGSETLQAGQPVQLCKVDKRLMASAPSPVPWYFPAADAIAAGKSKFQILQADDSFKNRLLIAGCDPGVSVLARHVQAAGIELVLAHRNSSQALALLKAGCVHIAGTHLRDEASGESNLPAIGRMFPKHALAVISFAVWEEGIVTATGNPRGIAGIADFARKDVAIVNREAGAGIRMLLDSHLARLKIPSARVRGYDRAAQGHLAAAWQVRAGAADCCLATRAAARMLGLGFIPLVTERYDLVIRKQHLELAAIQNLLDTLHRSSFRRELEGLGGYDTRGTGQRML